MFNTEMTETPEIEPEILPEGQVTMPPIEYRKGGVRYQLILNGACTRCAHCALKLTDSVSIQRGIGPVCSSKGYAEEPTDGDDLQALMDLAEYPALVEYLTNNYKADGKRALMNGLVRICSLNRRSPVHQACCDAIQSLGYHNLASTLRESIAVVEIKDSKDYPGCMEVWVKKSEFKWTWNNDIKKISGIFFSKLHKAWILPITKEVSAEYAHEVPSHLFVEPVGPEGRTYPAKVWLTSQIQDTWNSPPRTVNNKRYLWEKMILHYEGFCAKTPKGTIKIVKT